LTDSPTLDAGENLKVKILNLEQIKEEVKKGTFRQALAISALSQVFDLRNIYV